MRQNFTRFPVDVQIQQDVLVDTVIIVLVVRIELVRPNGFSGLRMARKDAGSPFVVARPLLRISRPRV